MKKLKNLLLENPYRGRECEGDEEDTGNKVTVLHFIVKSYNLLVNYLKISTNFKNTTSDF